MAVLRALLVAIVAPAAALLAGLSLARPAPRADFVVAAEEPRTLDPLRVSWNSEIQVAAALFEGLTRPNPQTLAPEPAVAERWETSAAGTQYLFYLRPDARWSNGKPVLAEHFRFAWLLALEPQAESQYASLLFVIRGAEAYYRSRLNADASDDVPAEQVGIEALDADSAGDSASRLRVTLAGPCPYFLDLTSFITLAPLHPPTIRAWVLRDGHVQRATRHRWTRPENIVCNGAFVLADWEFKRRLLLTPNPHYWDRGAVHLRSIEVLIAADPNTALLAYESGRVDLVRGLPTSVARVLRAAQQAGRRTDFHIGDRFATYFFRVNCRRPPLDNADLRKALCLAIDRDALCAHVLGLGETPAYAYVPLAALPLLARTGPAGETIDYEPPDGLGRGLPRAAQIDLAREDLRHSGFDRLAPTRPIELMYAAHPDYQRVAQAVQAMWESVLGIRVELRAVEGKVLSTRIRNLDYDVVRTDWFGDYLDPGTFLDMFTSSSGQNRTGFSNAEYDRLIAAAALEPDARRRYRLFHDAERILCEQELPIIPLFHMRGSFLLNPHFSGLYDNVRDVLPIQRVRPSTAALLGWN